MIYQTSQSTHKAKQPYYTSSCTLFPILVNIMKTQHEANLRKSYTYVLTLLFSYCCTRIAFEDNRLHSPPPERLW